MRIVQSVPAMQRLATTWRSKRLKLGFVPTMGYLHAGHMSLVEYARRNTGRRGKVVVSVYVNPTQFGPTEDFSRYPRDLTRDMRLCRAAGVDVFFAPSDKEMYARDQSGGSSTFVTEEALSRGMEGASRPTHFRGVATIVAKLFNIVLPSIAIFGAKDYQQAAVVRRMARDLSFPVQILVAPTHREKDGLAMSSRNKYLQGTVRAQAPVLWRSIHKVKAAVRNASKPLPALRLKSELKRFIEQQPAARLDYVEFFDSQTLAPLAKVTRGTHMALAVFLGKTRLIDNARL
jgi:pantoate--beta-alanine ligase